MTEAARREARRQRILQRGTDRLAFITGERKSLAAECNVEHVQSVSLENEPAPTQGLSPASGVESSAEQVHEAQENGHDIDSAHPVDRSRQNPMVELVRTLEKQHSTSTGQPESTEFPTSASKPSSGWSFSRKALGTAIEASRLPRALLAIVIAVATVAVQSGILGNMFTRVHPPVVLFTSSIALVICMWFLESTKLQKNQKSPGAAQTPALALNDNYNKLDRVLKSSEMVLSTVLTAKQFVSALSGDLSVYLLVLVCSMAWCK